MPNFTPNTFLPTVPIVIIITHIFQQLRYLRLGHISNTCNFVIRITGDFDIDSSFWVHIKRVKGFVGPDI